MHVKLCWGYKATREVLCNWKNSNVQSSKLKIRQNHSRSR